MIDINIQIETCIMKLNKKSIPYLNAIIYFKYEYIKNISIEDMNLNVLLKKIAKDKDIKKYCLTNNK